MDFDSNLLDGIEGAKNVVAGRHGHETRGFREQRCQG